MKLEQYQKTILSAVFVIALFTAAILFARSIQSNSGVQEVISSFGIFGILLVSFIAGLNLVVPVPATAFIPVFSAAGFPLWLIISIIILGTTIADLLSYYIGTVIRPHVDKQEHKIYQLVHDWCEGKIHTTQLIVFLWAAFAPLPNELVLLPLGALGVKLRALILVFVFGTTVHVTLLAYGLMSII